MISELNTLQQRHLNFSNFPNKLVGGYLGIFGGGVLPGFPTPSLRSRRCTRKNVCASRRHARGDLTPRVSPSRAPVLSFAHHFRAPATQATRIVRDTLVTPTLDNSIGLLSSTSKCLWPVGTLCP